MRDCFWRIVVMLVIELISKCEICSALWSLVVFDLGFDQTQDNIVIVFLWEIF